MDNTYTVFVTGGAGFIGSHLVDRLVELGHKVVVIDDLSTGKLQHLNKSAAFHHMSITSPHLQEVLEREKPQIIMHHSAQVSVSHSVRDPVKDAEINILGTLRLIEAANESGVEKFIFASTGGAVYGDPEVIPCPEDHPSLPLSPYGLSKLVSEQYLDLYYRLHRLNFTCLRYSNVYGPRQDPFGEAGVIAIFTRAMLEGKQPRMYGTGEQERDFVYVEDVVEANLLAMERGDGGTYNIGTGVGTSVNRIFELLAGILKYRWKPLHAPARPGDVFKITLDVSKAARELQWTPRVPLEDGLHRTVEYFRHNMVRSGEARSAPGDRGG